MTKTRKIKVKKLTNKENTEEKAQKASALNNTKDKQKEWHGTKNLIPAKKGEPSRNPKGRPKGSRNKFGEAFLKDFLAEWEEGGAEALKRVRTFDPATFIKVAASILPKEIKLDSNNETLEQFLEQFQSIEEIDEFIKGITALGVSDGDEAEKAALQARSQSDVVH